MSNFSNIKNILMYLNKYIIHSYYTYIYRNYYTISRYNQFIVKAIKNITRVKKELF